MTGATFPFPRRLLGRAAPERARFYISALPRVWMGRIRPLDERAYDQDDAEHPQFTELVRLLIEKGEARGWHRPKDDVSAVRR